MRALQRNRELHAQGPGGAGLSMFNESVTLVPSHELSWDQVQQERKDKRDLQSLLFKVLAEAGDLLTIPREPEEMFEPILDLVETALLEPERIFVLLLEKGKGEPVTKASRVKGSRSAESLALSRTMMTQVLEELPSRTEIVLHVEMSKEETAFYEAIRQMAVEQFTGDGVPDERKRFQVLAEITRLRQACCNPNLIAPELGLPSAKQEVLLNVVDESVAKHLAILLQRGHAPPRLLELTLVRLEALLERRGPAGGPWPVPGSGRRRRGGPRSSGRWKKSGRRTTGLPRS